MPSCVYIRGKSHRRAATHMCSHHIPSAHYCSECRPACNCSLTLSFTVFTSSVSIPTTQTLSTHTATCHVLGFSLRAIWPLQGSCWWHSPWHYWVAALPLLLYLRQGGRAGAQRCPDHVSDATASKTELDWLWKWEAPVMACFMSLS